MAIKYISEVRSLKQVVREISPTPPIIFTGVKMCEIWRRFQHHLNMSRQRLKMQQDIRTLKQKSNAAMIALCPRQVWWSLVHAPLKKLCQLWSTPKIAQRKRPKSSITQLWIIPFHSNFVQTLTLDVPWTFKVTGPEVKVTTLRNVSTWETL